MEVSRMKTIKKRISKLYKNLGRFARKFIAPVLSFLFGGAFFFYIGKFTHGYVLEKTSSNTWAWIIAIAVVILLIILGAANDSANAKVDNERNAQKNLTQHNSEHTAPPPFTAGNAEYQYMRVPKF
jgi:TM2 domain-containing membrane protein YozV